jgi:hypothetical protein
MYNPKYDDKLFELTKKTNEISDRYSEPASEKEFGVSIEIDNEVHQKIMHWVDKSDFEVSGLGLLEYDKEENVFRVTDAILLPQKNTSVSTEINGADVAKAMFLLKDKPGTLRWWWHSHVDMDVFWSGTDLATIKELGSGGWFVATVFNKKREMKSAFCQIEPIRLMVDDIETDVVEQVDEELVETWDKDYEKNVSNVSFVSSYGGFAPNSHVPMSETEDMFPSSYLSRNQTDENRKLTKDEEEFLTYFDLDELHEMKTKGKISERVWDEAIERASDEEIDEFFECEELENMDMNIPYERE